MMTSESHEDCREFESLLSGLSTAFINLSESDFKNEIKRWLQKLVVFLSIERGTIIEFSEDRRRFVITNSWAVSGFDHLTHFPSAKELPWLSKKIFSGEIVKFTKPEDLPGQAVKEKSRFNKMNLVSGINMPLSASGTVLGMLVFDALRKQRLWPEELVQRLKIVAEIIANAIKRKRSEEALRESEEKFRQLAEQSPNMIFINQRGRIIYANALCEELMGYKIEEFYSEDFDFLKLVDSDYRGIIEANFMRHMDGIEVPATEYPLRTKNNERIETLITTRLIKLRGERAILGIVTDITELKRARDDLKENEENFKAIAENANDGFLVTIDGTYHVYANKAAHRITGYSIKELKWMAIDKLVVPEDREKIKPNLKRRFNNEGISRQYLTAIIRNDGSRVPIEITTAQTIWKKQSAVLFIFRDISERKIANDELHKASEELQLEREALDRKSIALNEVTKQLNVEKDAIRQQVDTKIETVLMPILERIKETSLDRHKKHLELLEREMESLASTQKDRLRDYYDKLTPREMEICRLIKLGYLSKEISEMLHVSILTIHKHRELIRKKLGLKNKRINLISHLRSM